MFEVYNVFLKCGGSTLVDCAICGGQNGAREGSYRDSATALAVVDLCHYRYNDCGGCPSNHSYHRTVHYSTLKRHWGLASWSPGRLIGGSCARRPLEANSLNVLRKHYISKPGTSLRKISNNNSSLCLQSFKWDVTDFPYGSGSRHTSGCGLSCTTGTFACLKHVNSTRHNSPACLEACNFDRT